MGNTDSGPNSDPPMRIGRYAVKRELGRGGMGVVYLAHDAELERDVAIKTLPGVDETNPDRLRRFEREAKVLAAINHPNIATIYSIDKTEDGLRFIVLEYVEGETLGRVLKKNAVNMRQAIELCIQTAKAIAAAHAKGIVHRDIKPGNVMVTTDMTVKVLDFGLSMREPTGASDIDVTRTLQTMPGQVMGTPGYMSPEQARGKPVDKRADIWSFGCILFQTLTGQPAFQGDTSTDIIASTLHNEPTWTKLPASTPRNMRELLQRMLAKNADDRLDDMSVAIKVLTDSLHRFSATGSVTAAHYGNFEAVKELDSSSHASIWEVRPTSRKDEAGDNGEAPSSVQYIAKIVEPPSVNLAPDQTMRLLNTFRSGTAVQKKLADSLDASHWAKILDHGQFPGGAFYITERADHTLSQLLRRGDRPMASEVHSIIQGIVAALVELDQMFQRPHGNLKPSNVLLREDTGNAASEEARWNVLLTDPASDSELETGGRHGEDDLRQLGLMLYQLVEGKEWSAVEGELGQNGVELPLSNAWKRLGAIGEPMHGLCCELLSENSSTLAEVESRLSAMFSQRGGLPMKPLMAAAATALVLAVGGWFAFAAITSKPAEVTMNDGSQGRDVAPPVVDPEPPLQRDGATHDETARQKYDAIRANWLDDLIGNPPVVPFSVIESIGGGDALRRSVDDMRRIDPEDLSEGYIEAMLLVDNLRDNLRAALVDPVRRLAAIWDGGMRWSTAAQELRDIAADMRSLLEANEPVESETGQTFADQVSRIETVLRKRDEVDNWDRLLRRVDEVTAAMAQQELDDDPILRRMKESIELEFGAASIDDLHDLLAGWNETVGSLESAIERIANVDMAYMRQSSAVYERADNPEGLRRQHFAAWVEAVEGGRYDIPRDDPREDQQLVNELADKWRELRELRAQFHPEACPDIEQPAGRGTEDLQEQLDAITWEPTHATRNRILDQIEALRSSLRREIADWNQVVLTCQLGCEEELTMLIERDLPMDELPAAAQELLEPALQKWSEVRTGEHLPCEQRRDAARHLSQFFHRASEHLFSPGPVPDDIPATITPARAEALFRQKWDELVEPKLRVARAADWQEGIARNEPIWRELDEAREEYEEWRRTAGQLLADYRDIEQWLNLAFGWEQVRERYQPGGNPWPERPIYADLSRPLEEISRITSDVEKLRAMEARQVAGIADAQYLVAEIAREVETPAHRWAAWRRLAEAARFRNFLDWEDEVAPHIESMLSEIERVRYRTLENTWRIGRRERWIANAAAADDRRWLHEAFDRMEDFGIADPADITDPRVRFNLDLKKLRERVREFIAIEEDDEAGRRQLQGTARQLSERLDTLDAPESKRAAWQKLLTEIADFDVDEDVDTGPAWSQMGPARAGWEWELIDEGAVVRYFPPEEWRERYAPLLGELAHDGAALKFRRVIVGDAEEDDASYISTAEISAGLFMAIAKHAGAESLLRRELLGESSSGARVWEWRGGEMSPVRDMWMGFQRFIENDLPPPSLRYPMQNLTPASAVYVAGLLGCRLPTEREWREALTQAIRDQGTIRAHLLGSRLSDLIARVAAYNEGRFEREHEPNHHSFPQVLRMELSRMDNTVRADPLIGNIEAVDATWFQPTDMTSRQFQHLVGNVAEFIFMDEIDFERFAELPDAAEQPQAFLDKLRAILVPGDQGDDAAIRVIGGSIFFAMNEHPILQPLPYAQARRIPTRLHQQTYADVGFRLAFDSTAQLSGEERFRQLVKTVLDEQDREPFLLARRR